MTPPPGADLYASSSWIFDMGACSPVLKRSMSVNGVGADVATGEVETFICGVQSLSPELGGHLLVFLF